jgi:hypothetical protein
VLVEKISKRQACRQFSIHWDALKRLLAHAVPPGYLRQQAVAKAVIAAWLGLFRTFVDG